MCRIKRNIKINKTTSGDDGHEAGKKDTGMKNQLVLPVNEREARKEKKNKQTETSQLVGGCH